jgi:dihydrofolate reductase
MTKISLIAAISENKVIGRDNDLPWHIPEDLKRFKEITKGHPVIMGRKTYESIGRLLPNRINIIITRDVEGYLLRHPELVSGSNWIPDQVRNDINKGVVVSSLDEAIKEAKKVDQEEIFIIGGGQIFEQSITIANKIYLTIVHTNLEGDVYFPEYLEFTKEVFKKESSNDEYSYTFLELEK